MSAPEQTTQIRDDALQIILQVMADHEGRADIDTLTQHYSERSAGQPNAATLAMLEQLLVREATPKGYVLLPSQQNGEWQLQQRGREFLQESATEAEEQGDLRGEIDSSGLIVKPFNPALIKVDTDNMMVYHALRKIIDGEIVLDPEFQRNFVWDKVRQSRLIESILLRIPLPAFYFDATKEDKWLIVDGLQRLSTLHEFCNKKSFGLTGLQYLTDLQDKRFDQLPTNLQRAITERTKLTTYIIQPETPRYVKFMIFSRVNTGGLPLTPQEIRHALYQGAVTPWLKRIAKSDVFLKATAGSVSPLRMDDRECALRFIAFYLNPYQEFGSRVREGEPANLESLLNRTMDELNDMPIQRRDEIGQVFQESMKKAHAVFGDKAFRKLYSQTTRRLPVSKPLFEVWSVLLTAYPLAALQGRKAQIVKRFIALMDRRDSFEKAISYGTGSKGSITERFRRIQQLLEEVMA